jgi:hypothetical protein
MGTSASHPSPKTLRWAAVASMYGEPRFQANQVLQEVWGALAAPGGGRLANDLASAAVVGCLSALSSAASKQEMARLAAQAVIASGRPSVAADLAKRAAIQACSAGDARSRVPAFAQALFAEATDYLVARDLSGLIGERARVRSATDAVAFRQDLRRLASAAVAGTPLPDDVVRSARGWRAYVQTVVDRLRGRR